MPPLLDSCAMRSKKAPQTAFNFSGQLSLCRNPDYPWERTQGTPRTVQVPAVGPGPEARL